MQKVLAIDVGNSLTKIGCFLDGHLEALEQFATEKENLSLYQQDLTENLEGLAERFEGVVISSVVPAVTPMFRELLQPLIPPNKLLILDRNREEEYEWPGVDLSAYAHHELGTDRIANIVGGRQCQPDHRILICDFGTTATFDLVERDGAFIGGAICPGPRKFQSLLDARHAAQLYEVDVFEKPLETPGTSTRACLQNGLYYGYKGIILEIVGNLLQQAQWPLSQVRFQFTGGDAQPVRELLEAEIPQITVDQGLTLKGLYAIWRHNTKTPVSHEG